MIIIESHKKSLTSLKAKYPGAIIADATSKATTGLVKLSPFYPHFGIPIPFTPNMTATCVEAVWQGLKVFEHQDVDVSMFDNDTMKNLKRTVKRFGKPLGHRKGVYGSELLDYKTARELIFIPTYKWMIEHKVMYIIERLRSVSKKRTIVLLDYNTCEDVDNLSKPLSHAFLVKAYVEGLYPYDKDNNGLKVEDVNPISMEKDGQLNLFDL
jgi:hypothetical protein